MVTKSRALVGRRKTEAKTNRFNTIAQSTKRDEVRTLGKRTLKVRTRYFKLKGVLEIHEKM